MDLPEHILKISNAAMQDMLPDKSAIRYVQTFDKFVEWQRNQNTNSFDKKVLLAYFYEISQKCAPSSLWCTYSMLKKTIISKQNINIKSYAQLISFIKKKNAGFKTKKSNVFTSEDIQNFLLKASDCEYLAVKTVTVFGMCGGWRGDEMVNVKNDEVKDYDKEILVRIADSKTHVPKCFPISGSFADIVRKYMQLRPPHATTTRFFVQYRKGKCTTQNIGKHSIASMPRKIAEFLELPDAKTFTGHSFRRTSTTILADAGASMDEVMRFGDWASAKVAGGYIQESIQHKRNTVSKITGAINLDKHKTNDDNFTAEDTAMFDIECDEEDQNISPGFREHMSQVLTKTRIVQKTEFSVKSNEHKGIVGKAEFLRFSRFA